MKTLMFVMFMVVSLAWSQPYISLGVDSDSQSTHYQTVYCYNGTVPVSNFPVNLTYNNRSIRGIGCDGYNTLYVSQNYNSSNMYVQKVDYATGGMSGSLTLSTGGLTPSYGLAVRSGVSYSNYNVFVGFSDGTVRVYDFNGVSVVNFDRGTSCRGITATNDTNYIYILERILDSTHYAVYKQYLDGSSYSTFATFTMNSINAIYDCAYYNGKIYFLVGRGNGNSNPIWYVNENGTEAFPYTSFTFSGFPAGIIGGIEITNNHTPVGDTPFVEISSFNLTPSMNPFMSTVTIYGSGVGSIQIFDISGRMILDDDFSGDYIWDASNEVSGMYFVCVTSSVGTSILNVVKL